MGRQNGENLGPSCPQQRFSGALSGPYMYPWPQRPAGLVDQAFKELANRWTPILNAYEGCHRPFAMRSTLVEDLRCGIPWRCFRRSDRKSSRVNILYDPSHFCPATIGLSAVH